MRYYRATPRAALTISLEEVKAQAIVQHEDDDPLLQAMLEAAWERAEQETGLVFGVGNWVIEADPTGDLMLPIWPVLSVVSVVDGETAFTDYEMKRCGRGSYLRSSAWPASVTIVVSAGMDMPTTVRRAILMMVAFWYDNRSTATSEARHEMPLGSSALLGLNRRVFV